MTNFQYMSNCLEFGQVNKNCLLSSMPDEYLHLILKIVSVHANLSQAFGFSFHLESEYITFKLFQNFRQTFILTRI